MAEPADDASGSWVTVSALARLRGVDKAAISRRVTRLEAAGALTTRAGPRGTKLINAEEFSRAVEEMTDPVREANGRRAGANRDGAGGSSITVILSQQQARRASYDADIKKLTRDRLLGELARVEDIAAGAALHGEALARVFDRLPDRADDLAAVVAKEGSTGLRVALKDVARDLRGALASAFAALAEAPTLAAAEIDQAEPEESESPA